MSKGLRNFLIVISIILLIVLAGIFFVNKILPKIAVNYLTGENAPIIMQELNSQISKNAVIFNQVLKENGITNEQAVNIVKNFDYKDLYAIQKELHAEGYDDKSKCAEIIVSHMEDDTVDKEKVKKLIEKNISPAVLENGMNQMANTNPSYIKMAFPYLKEIAVKSLKEAEEQK